MDETAEKSECTRASVLLCVECSSYHGVFARFHSVTLQETDKNHLHDEDGVAHPNAVTRTKPEWHVGVRVHLLPTVLTEPAHTDRHTNTFKTKSQLREQSYACLNTLLSVKSHHDPTQYYLR